MSQSFDTIRNGRRYYLRNYGETTEFEVLEVLEKGDFKIKDLNTLEICFLKDLIRYGKGNDYKFEEIP